MTNYTMAMVVYRRSWHITEGRRSLRLLQISSLNLQFYFCVTRHKYDLHQANGSKRLAGL